jgi:hypothetical protein
LYIATYAILGQIKSDQSFLDLATRTAKAAMAARWHTPEGIIKEGQGPALEGGDSVMWKPILVRSLAKAAPILGGQIQRAIRQYLNIQYWGASQHDADSGSKPVWFGRNWQGPYEGHTDQTQK